MTRAERTPTALYMRGTDPAHHLHVTEKGDPKYVGFAYYAPSEDDLKRIAKAPGASGIEHLDEPGGGKRVRLTEPNGYQIEIVHGIASVPPIPVRRQPLNSGPQPLARPGELMRLPKGPSQVKRVGHGVMMTPKFEETRRLVPRDAGLHLLGRRLRRRAGQPDRLVQPLRPRRQLRRSSRLLLPAAREDRHQPCLVRGRRTSTTSRWAMTISRSSASTSTSGGSAGTCWAARSTTTGPIPGAACTSTGPTATASTSRTARTWSPADEALVSQWGEPPPEKFINHASPMWYRRTLAACGSGSALPPERPGRRVSEASGGWGDQRQSAACCSSFSTPPRRYRSDVPVSA